ncbi:MAG: putative sulfate/molybdate transporter [Candidatus Melainabacteria bacterium]|nr:putative sulfate/molybdate transporter [Candidatus Melainabacteria bacterium]
MKSKLELLLSELSGAVADLGILLPLAFALFVFNGFSASKLFILWGIVYIATGLYFKIPVSVQPLKAMAIIAIASGFDQAFLASTAFFYGLLMLVLTATGLITKLKQIFSLALIRGVQIGIGLILASKAFGLLIDKGLFVFSTEANFKLNLLLAAIILVIVYLSQRFTKLAIAFWLVVSSILLVKFAGISFAVDLVQPLDFSLVKPEPSILWQALPLLILPQLPLTLGNAVYAAADSAQELYPNKSKKLEAENLSNSIGISNIFLGLFGGFPVCHGAGGIVAHHKMGARTGASTITLGIALILLSLNPSTRNVLFQIPIPVLAALLLMAAWQMLAFASKLESKTEFIIAIIVALISFVSHNLFLAILAGFVLEKFLKFQKAVIK